MCIAVYTRVYTFIVSEDIYMNRSEVGRSTPSVQEIDKHYPTNLNGAECSICFPFAPDPAYVLLVNVYTYTYIFRKCGTKDDCERQRERAFLLFHKHH